jgi:hypothetical protein
MPYNTLYILRNVVGSHNAIGVGANYGSKINKLNNKKNNTANEKPREQN